MFSVHCMLQTVYPNWLARWFKSKQGLKYNLVQEKQLSQSQTGCLPLFLDLTWLKKKQSSFFDKVTYALRLEDLLCSSVSF